MSTDAKKKLPKKTKKEAFLEILLDHARKVTKQAIRKYCKRCPPEQQDEILQMALLMVLELFDKKQIRRKFWKTYLRIRCRGLAQDYKKQGTGFEDGAGWVRFENMNSEDDEISVDQVLSSNGVFSKWDPARIEIKWEMLAKLASMDFHLECFLKQIRSEKLKEISPVMGVSVSRADQFINEFIERFDDPERYHNDWDIQIAWALGISEMLGLPNKPLLRHDGGIVGDSLIPINLDDETVHQNILHKKAQAKIDEKALGNFKIPDYLKDRAMKKAKEDQERQENQPVEIQQAFDI